MGGGGAGVCWSTINVDVMRVEVGVGVGAVTWSVIMVNGERGDRRQSAVVALLLEDHCLGRVGNPGFMAQYAAPPLYCDEAPRRTLHSVQSPN